MSAINGKHGQVMRQPEVPVDTVRVHAKALSAIFCTVVVATAVVAHVKTFPEIAGETVDTAKKLWHRARGD